VIRVPFISCALLLIAVACGGRDPVDDKAGNTAGLPDGNVSAPSAAGEPHVATVPAQAMPVSPAKIPAALEGRWGLAPADCLPGRSDAKGLLVVTPEALQFYESRAVPAADVDTDADSISGNFTFTGEGQSWTKYVSLKIDRQMLVRTETKPTVSFNYAKCS
jgi:hypothetical protein